MGLFEQVAVADLKLRVVLAAAVLAFAAVALPVVFVLRSGSGFALGAIAAVAVGYLTAKRIA